MGAITATVIASTLATSVPFNVLTVKAAEEVATRTNLKSVSMNLIKNPQFNGLTGWVTKTQSSYSDGWYYSDNDNTAVKANGDGTMDMWVKNNQLGIAYLYQPVQTVPGHRYQFTATVTDRGNGRYAAMLSNVDGDSVTIIASTGGWVLPGNTSIDFTAKSRNSRITFNGNSQSGTAEGNTRFSNVKLVDLDAVDVTVNALNTKSKTVSGLANPYAKVSIYVGSTKIGTGTADSNGNYTITIPTQVKGTTVRATDDTTGLSGSNIVTQGALQQTTIQEITTTSQTVSGTAEPNANVEVRNGAGTLIASGRANASGAYSFPISAQHYNDTITATASIDNQTSSASTKVRDVSTPSKPTVNPLTDDDTTLSGTGTPGDKIEFVIGDKTYMGTIDAEGHFAIVVPKLPGGTVVNVVEVNPNNGNRSTPTEVTVRDTTLAKPTISPIKTGDTKVVITGEPGATVVLTTPDGEQTSKTADATGKATFTVDPAKVGDTFTATQTGANGKASPAATANVTAVVTTGTITTKDFTLGKDKNIEGTYTGDVKSFRVTIDGTVYAGGAINTSSKTYTFYALDKITKTGSFKIEGLDASGQVLDTKTGNIVANQTPNTPGTGTITANAFTIHQDKTVTGRLTGDVTSIGLVYNGTEYRGGTVNSDGTYSFYALNTITDKTKSAVMNGYDRNGNRIATSAITLYDAQDSSSSIGTGAMTAHNFVLGVDRNITGTFTGDVRSLGVTIGGVDYRGGSLNADGTFNFYAWDKIKNTTDAVVVNGYDRNGNRIATSAVSVTKPSSSGTITPNTFTIPTDRYLTASYTGDVKAVKVTINGVDYTGGTVSGGQVNFYIGDKIKATSDIVKISAYDAYGQLLNQQTVQVASASSTTEGTVTPDRFTAGRDMYLTGTYTGDVKAVKVSINGTLYAGGTVAGGQINFYIGNKISSSGDDVKLYGYDAYGKQLDVKDVDVKNINGDIQPDAYTVPGDSFLTANVSSAVQSVRVTINGTVYTGGTIADGRLSFWIGDKIKSTSDKVSIVALDCNGRELDSKTVQLVAAKPAVGTVTPATFSLKTSSVTGTYTGEAKSVRLTVNGTVLPAGGSVTGGQFSYYVGMKNKITSTSDQVKIELLDKNGLVMDTKTVSVSE
ncbi:cell wall-associated (serine) protease [Listeria fleischmannii]|uniref:Cell wall-associated (Serine) protease n=2 Tax=Listeria fleischmannii TaxID=1069827 RepID=A0A841YDH4_9LIST|nr:cell wall-associated (serine) protease [Listeria fleischmannii]MBC1426436.1 cell wall-associated (serine) protease [Listeria fleischmannii]